MIIKTDLYVISNILFFIFLLTIVNSKRIPDKITEFKINKTIGLFISSIIGILKPSSS